MESHAMTVYNLALLDIKIGSTPQRKNDKNFQWSNGQMSILNAYYKELASLSHRLDMLKNEKNDKLNEIISYEGPAQQLLSNTGTQEIDLEIERTLIRKNNMQQELQQLEEDIYNRGGNLENKIDDEGFERAEVVDQPSHNKAKNSSGNERSFFSRFSHIIQFILLWIIGEVFLTYIQWSTLRDDKSIEELLVRSLAFGVCLGLFHYVSYKNKKQYRMEYVIFLILSLSMILSMLFGPLIINSIYPLQTMTEFSNHWDLATSEGKQTISYPVLVEIYRKYDIVIPSIITFFAFLIMESFMKEKSYVNTQSQKLISESPISMNGSNAKICDEIDVYQPLRNRVTMLKKNIVTTDQKLRKLEQTRNEIMYSNTLELNVIKEEIVKHESRVLEIEDDIKTIVNKVYTIMNEVFSQLEKYKTDFIDILRTDIKANLIQTNWPEKLDFLLYFKLDRHEEI